VDRSLLNQFSQLQPYIEQLSVKVATNIDNALRMDRFLSQKVQRAPLPGPLGALPYPPMPLARS
jgi:hypothetical protein